MIEEARVGRRDDLSRARRRPSGAGYAGVFVDPDGHPWEVRGHGGLRARGGRQRRGLPVLHRPNLSVRRPSGAGPPERTHHSTPRTVRPG